jgi:hypothetical protein
VLAPGGQREAAASGERDRKFQPGCHVPTLRVWERAPGRPASSG